MKKYLLVVLFCAWYNSRSTTFSLPSLLATDFQIQKNKRSFKEQAVIGELLKNYSSTVRPKGTIPVEVNGTTKFPVFVNVTVWVLSLSSFNDVTMEFTAQLGFQQEWYDHRLKFSDSYFQESDFINLASDQRLWVPDTFFQNEQEGHTHQIDQPNQFVKINSKGWVKYKKRYILHPRLTMAFSCPMNLMLFPHDNQTCVIEFASYAYTTTDIILRWSPLRVILLDDVIDSLPKFSLEDYDNQLCTSNTSTVSCVSFWIDWRSTPARVPLTIVTLLTITTQAHGINANLPPVSYTKAIDIWIGACVVFIFGSLIEYAIVNYIGSNEEKRKAKNRGTPISADFQLFLHRKHTAKYQLSLLINNHLHNAHHAMVPLLDEWRPETYGSSTETYPHDSEAFDSVDRGFHNFEGLRFRFRPTDKRRKQREYHKEGEPAINIKNHQKRNYSLLLPRA